MTLLIDIGALSERQSDRALNTIYKAIHNHGDDDSIWNPHDSPFIRRLIELFTQRGLMRLDGFRDELGKWLAGEKHRAGQRVPRPDGMMQRWTPGELELVKLYLEALPPAQFTLDDWMMVVDYLTQRYLPIDDLRTEAEWLAVRATLMGRVQANMENLDAKQADTVLAALPSTVQQAEAVFNLTPVQRSILNFARVRAVENVSKLSDDTRHRMRSLVAHHIEEEMIGAPSQGRQALQSKLLDEFGTLNRDWRRIAVTEAGECANQGYVASLQPGAKVKRVEQYRNACPFCRKIDGMIMNVVSADDPDKDGDTDIWPGKTNIGRSSAPRKRVGSILVEREPEERWWVAAGVQHPHCRGRWLPVIEDQPGDDKDFGDWLRQTLGKKNVPATES